MAEDETVESPSVEGGVDRSLESLREELAEKQDRLQGLRAQRMQEQVEASTRVQAAQLVQAIRSVDAEIATEESLLENQENLDAQLVGTGIPTDPDAIPEPPPLVNHEEVAEQVSDPDTDTEDALQTVEFGQAAEVVARREDEN